MGPKMSQNNSRRLKNIFNKCLKMGGLNAFSYEALGGTKNVSNLFMSPQRNQGIHKKYPFIINSFLGNR